MLNTPLSPWPSFSPEEVDAVADVIRSNRVNYWTGGEGRAFEREFAEWIGVPYAIAVANGTLALDLALAGLGIGTGDEVIVTPRTFIASVSSVVSAGATPVFADVDADSGNITPATARAVLTERTRAIIPVHLAGWPADMEGFCALAAERDLKLIEDCAQAHGAAIDGRPVGGWGDAGAWSFCQDKIMTTGGEGGMVTAADPDLWRAMWAFKDHGKSFEAVYEREHPPGFRWLHESFGTNWRMLEVQAAIGRVQLTRMAAWTERRTAIARRYADTLAPFASAIRAPWPDERLTQAAYRFYAYVRPEGLKPDWTRDRIVAEATKAGAPLYQGSCSEVYRERAFDGTDWRPAEPLPVAQELGETSVMFLTHPTLTVAEVEGVCATVARVLEEASA